MYNKTIILKSRPAGLLARAGRSLCRHRPVSLPVSAGLYAGIGRSLCQSRPVSMPANPFSTVSQNSFCFLDFGRPKNEKCDIS